MGPGVRHAGKALWCVTPLCDMTFELDLTSDLDSVHGDIENIAQANCWFFERVLNLIRDNTSG